MLASFHALHVRRLQYKIRAEFHTASNERARPGNEATEMLRML